MGQLAELIKAYAPLVAAVLIVAVLHRGLHGAGLNLSLLALIVSDGLLMVRQRNGGRDSELVLALMRGPPTRTRDVALYTAYLPKIAVEILTRFVMPASGDLALTVLYVALFVQNVTLFFNGGEIVTGDVPPVASSGKE